MPSSDENPFVVLGIRQEDARRLAAMDESARSRRLSDLRRFYGGLYHSDVTGNPEDTQKLAAYNNALDVLGDESRFMDAFRSFRMPQVVPNGSSPHLARQAEYVKERAQARTLAAERMVEEARSTIEGKDAEIKELQKRLRASDDEKLHLEGTIYSARERNNRYGAKIRGLRRDILSTMEQLRNVAFFDGSSLKVPEEMLGLDEAGGFDYILEAPEGSVIRVYRDLRGECMDKKPRGYLLPKDAKLFGSVRSIQFGDTNLGYNKFVTSNIRSVGYDEILRSTKPYIGIGMYPIFIPPGRIDLYLVSKVIDMKPVKMQ